MENARYFRDQATLCLEIAQHMSDPHAAENLRGSAAKHFARATELEKGAESSVSPGSQDAQQQQPPGK
jgi:hypothetical protein